MRGVAMADYRIDCINKPNRNSPHEHITHVGGPNPDDNGRWKDTVPHVVQFIENKQHTFYTKEGNASAWVGVRTSAAGNKFLQTYADGVWKDNLLALSEC
jgi:hypothetical protein